MGVYNPWAEMPRSCIVCDFWYSCPLSSQNAHGLSSFKHPNCPLVEVNAPHGRLIDADALYMQMFSTGLSGKEDRNIAIDAVLQAPTVLEAERKDDG